VWLSLAWAEAFSEPLAPKDKLHMYKKTFKFMLLLASCAMVAIASPQLPPDCPPVTCDPSCLQCHVCCPGSLSAKLHGKPGPLPKEHQQHHSKPIPAKDRADMLFYASALPIGLGFALAGVRKALRRA